MKAQIVTSYGTKVYEVEDLANHFEIVGYMEDYSATRTPLSLCHRAELDNQPILKGFLSPMWNGDCLRYETQEVYNMLSI